MIRQSVEYWQDLKIPIRLWKSLVEDTPSLLLLLVRLKIYYASHYYVVCVIMSVCMCVKQQTDDLTLYA